MSDNVVKITKKIKSWNVVKESEAIPVVEAPSLETEEGQQESTVTSQLSIDETTPRPERLTGYTYKIKPPVLDHALYITINDVVLNEGQSNEIRRPFEIFINSKNLAEFQWIVGLTRIMSAIFRKGGDLAFLVEEMHSVFDPKGGYFASGGRYVPSLVSEIGFVLGQHLQSIGMVKPTLSPEQQDLIAKKRAEYEARENAQTDEEEDEGVLEADDEPAPPAQIVVKPPAIAQGFPASAQFCTHCNTKAMVLMDGCQTCLNCGYSKCG